MSQSTVRTPDPRDGTARAAERFDLLDCLASEALTRVVEQIRDMHPDLDGAARDLLHAAAIGKDLKACSEVARGLILDGVTAERICDVHIPDAVRRMGDEWVSGDLPFSTVTIGAARLQGLLRELDLDFASRPEHAIGAAGAILLVLPAGADHTLGALTLASRLRRKGFSVRLSLGDTPDAVAATTASTRFDGVFLSATMAGSLPQLVRTAAAIRSLTAGAPPIVLGGAVVAGSGGDGRGPDDSIGDVTGSPDFSAIDHVTCDLEEAMRLCGLAVAR